MNAVTWSGASLIPELANCAFELRSSGARFRRGDADDDGQVNLTDAIRILGCKFLGEPCPSCRDAADANDDGRLDISDAVNILAFLFLGGVTPSAPGPFGCGPDATADAIEPCVYDTCFGA